jgi:FtsZ-binding cell division protein ZapB
MPVYDCRIGEMMEQITLDEIKAIKDCQIDYYVTMLEAKADYLAREVYQLRKENEELQKRIDVLEATDNTWTHLTERGEIHRTTDRE